MGRLHPCRCRSGFGSPSVLVRFHRRHSHGVQPSVVRHGTLVAEAYFHGENVHSANPIQSATKSFTSALLGIALDRGLLSDLDESMVDFFPGFVTPTMDARKRNITIRHLLQMRAGYPSDGDGDLVAQLNADGNWLRFAFQHPLASSPGEGWAYSNLSAMLLGGILTTATGTSALAFAEEYLFEPAGMQPTSWFADPQGYHVGSGGLNVRPRDLARFGLLYLHGGRWGGREVIPSDWVAESWQDHSPTTLGDLYYFRDCRYGYLWWHAQTGGRNMWFAGGQGGQFVVVVPSLDMVVVTTAFHFNGYPRAEAERSERALTRVVDGLLRSVLP